MTGFPEPPKPPRAYTLEEAAATRVTYPDPPPPPKVEPAVLVNDTALSQEETALLLRKTLRPEQMDDPHILAFIDSYLRCRHNAQACKEAGIPAATGRRYLRTPEIYEAINQITQKATMKYGYDAAEVVERTKEIAGIDPIVFENPDGSYKTHLSQVPEEARRAIKKFKVKNIWGEDPNGMRVVIGQLIEVELHDKLKSIELLAREKNVFKETKKIEHDMTAQMGGLLLEAQSRAEQRALQAAQVSADVRDVVEIAGRVDERQG
jgi:hypothetical protein